MYTARMKRVTNLPFLRLSQISAKPPSSAGRSSVSRTKSIVNGVTLPSFTVPTLKVDFLRSNCIVLSWVWLIVTVFMVALVSTSVKKLKMLWLISDSLSTRMTKRLSEESSTILHEGSAILRYKKLSLLLSKME